MHRKAFRCGVLALLLTAAVALPAAAAARGSQSSRQARPAVERGWWGTVEDLALRVLAHLSGANRGGIDPNGAPTSPTDPTTTASPDPGDNRGGIDPNG